MFAILLLVLLETEIEIESNERIMTGSTILITIRRRIRVHGCFIGRKQGLGLLPRLDKRSAAKYGYSDYSIGESRDFGHEPGGLAHWLHLENANLRLGGCRPPRLGRRVGKY